MSAGKRIAQEAQLLAEERWLVNALQNIRNQRNSLQIERLQLESMLAQQKISQSSRDGRAPPSGRGDKTPGSIRDSATEDSQSGLTSICTTMYTAPDSRMRDLDDGVCNFEELNLSVTAPVFNLNDPLDFNIEFDEDEDTEDDFDDDQEENAEIDMNMFMNAESNIKSTEEYVGKCNDKKDKRKLGQKREG